MDKNGDDEPAPHEAEVEEEARVVETSAFEAERQALLNG